MTQFTYIVAGRAGNVVANVQAASEQTLDRWRGVGVMAVTSTAVRSPHPWKEYVHKPAATLRDRDIETIVVTPFTPYRAAAGVDWFQDASLWPVILERLKECADLSMHYSGSPVAVLDIEPKNQAGYSYPPLEALLTFADGIRAAGINLYITQPQTVAGQAIQAVCGCIGIRQFYASINPIARPEDWDKVRFALSDSAARGRRTVPGYHLSALKTPENRRRVADAFMLYDEGPDADLLFSERFGIAEKP